MAKKRIVTGSLATDEVLNYEGSPELSTGDSINVARESIELISGSIISQQEEVQKLENEKESIKKAIAIVNKHIVYLNAQITLEEDKLRSTKARDIASQMTKVDSLKRQLTEAEAQLKTLVTKLSINKKAINNAQQQLAILENEKQQFLATLSIEDRKVVEAQTKQLEAQIKADPSYQKAERNKLLIMGGIAIVALFIVALIFKK